ncbi:MAG: hypothetical protein PWQ79_1398 [Thermococcaceae archaeon]|nr:hypothetical protein [Thermococcaceae archaeon]MDK2914483.1 hypothetical protein [Thermococcaceae archaeon]
MEPFQVHAILNSLALLSFLAGAYQAKKHDLKRHHLFVYSAVGLLTLGVAYMLYTIGGVPSSHGKLGLFVYLYVLFAATSGKLFLGRKLKREQHRLIAITAVLLLALQILFGLYLYVL